MFRRKKDKPILKTEAEIEAMKEAGRVSALALELAGKLAQPGISTLEMDAEVEKLIRAQGGKPAFKGYGGFPGTICASIDEMVVHGIPSKSVVLKEGDIVSVDTGAVVDGWVGDNAATFMVGEVSAEKRALCEVTEASMWAGINAALAGNRLGDIGYAVQSYAEERGYGVVRDYGGHGVGRAMHERPHVPNYGRRGKGLRLEPGLVLAIEPMLTMGAYQVHTIRDGWGVVTNDRKPAAHFERTVAITEQGPVVLTAC